MFRSSVVAMTIACTLCLILGNVAARAEVRLAHVFQEHAVLQREVNIPVWGWDEPGEEVTVTLGKQSVKSKADADGKWLVSLAKMTAGGPHVLAATGSSTVEINDVLIGEVWLCSGQSNMAMTVARCKDFESEQTAATHPSIRMFKTAGHATPEIQTDCKGSWIVCSPETVGSFSGAAYFFGRKLQQELDVPIGLINSSWGGTDIAAWTSLSAQEAVPSLVPKLTAYNERIKSFDPGKAKANFDAATRKWEEKSKQAKQDGKPAVRRPRMAGDPRVNQNRPANLFNGMINPLVPYAIRGAIWYQGEHNSKSIETGQLYATRLQTLINDWRTRWNQGDFMFITVQLPNFRAPTKEAEQTTGWVALRESQMKSLRLKNTGIAITTDIGDAKDIHPKNKQDVGLRLATWALGTTYEHDGFETYSGPFYAFHQYRGHDANSTGQVRPGRLEVSFKHTGNELKTSDDKPVRGFAIAGEDRKFHKAKATLLESGLLMLSTPKVPDPVAARYNWSENPDGNLINSAGLPAAPFRTDRWELAEE